MVISANDAIEMLLRNCKYCGKWIPHKEEKGPELCCHRICEEEIEMTRVLQNLQYQVEKMEIRRDNCEACVFGSECVDPR